MWQEKFYNAEYGRCPRVFCKDQPVLPAAVSDIPHEEAVKVFCPSCEDMYSTRSRLDGGALPCLPARPRPRQRGQK